MHLQQAIAVIKEKVFKTTTRSLFGPRRSAGKNSKALLNHELVEGEVRDTLL
jgi:hypothetical protein